MKIKITIKVTIRICCTVGLWCLYYYCPCKVSFELEMQIPKPNKEFDQSQMLTFSYVRNEENLMRWFVYRFNSLFVDNRRKYLPQKVELGFDSAYTKNLS